MRIYLIPFFSSITPKERQENVLSQLRIDKDQIITTEQFFSKDYPVIFEDQFYFFVGTGGTEIDIATFIEHSNFQSPIILLSYDQNNSLPAAMETRSYFEEKGLDCRIIHSTLEDLAYILQKWNKFARIKEKLKNSRIGMIGTPSEWLIASRIDEKAILMGWGTKIVSIPISELIQGSITDFSEKTKAMSKEFLQQATETTIDSENIRKAVSVVEILQELAKKYQLDALSVECFSLILKTNITACYALSYLNDQGIVAGCEGDIPSTFTMLLVRFLTNQPSFMANVIHTNPHNNRIILAHCTVALDMLEEYSITTHFETGKSTAIRGNFQTPQEVTIVKVGGKKLTQWWITKGTILSNPNVPLACRTQIEVAIDKPVNYFLEKSLANHHIVILGDHTEIIQQFLEFILQKTT
ncbi:MAG: hypothetical protein ACFFCQ_12170 [Promethearchaeota archaeon]